MSYSPIIAVIGPSGSGKSTLLRLFNRTSDRHDGRKFNGSKRLVFKPHSSRGK